MISRMERTAPRRDVHRTQCNSRVIDREGEAPAEPEAQWNRGLTLSG